MKIESKDLTKDDLGKAVLYVPPSAKGDRKGAGVVEAKLVAASHSHCIISIKNAKGYNPPQPVLASHLVWK